MKLTIKTVRERLTPLGITIASQNGEFKVRRRGSARGEGYFTTALDDALATGLVIARGEKASEKLRTAVHNALTPCTE